MYYFGRVLPIIYKKIVFYIIFYGTIYIYSWPSNEPKYFEEVLNRGL
jgi:hypothetical protein